MIFNLRFTKLCKIHILILSFRLDGSNKNQNYEKIVSIIIERFIKSWHDAAQFLSSFIEDQSTTIAKILENINFLLTKLSDDLLTIDELTQGFVLTDVISESRKVNEQKTVEITEDLENNASMNPRETGMKFYVSFLNALCEGKIRLKEFLDSQMKDYSPKDNEHERDLLLLYFTITPNKIV